MTKLITTFTITLLLALALTCAARPLQPSLLRTTQPQEGGISEKVVEQGGGEVELGVSCEGVGNEECLRRKTMDAHIDYIYTQNQPHPHGSLP